MNDWELMTSLPGLFVGGDALFSSNCYGHAASTGAYAGRHAAAYASGAALCPPDETQAEAERRRVFAPLERPRGFTWKELNEATAKTMVRDFPRTLSLLRQEKKISQRKAAVELNVSQALLSHYENGVREPGLAFVVRAADYYGVSVDYLLGRTMLRPFLMDSRMPSSASS